MLHSCLSQVHEYAAEKLLATVQSRWTHEVAVGVAGYLLGEFGAHICEKPGMSGAGWDGMASDWLM